MHKEDIQPFDWRRVLFGQTPVEFLIEVFIRTVVVYIALVIVLKLLGKRMDGQLTIIEMAVMITIGAIIAVPMQIPDRGIVLGLVALMGVVLFQRGVNWITVKNEKLARAAEGTMDILVKDGMIQLAAMASAGISKQHLFSQLRNRQILNLGKVRRVYFEACGIFNIYLEQGEMPGLPLYPSDELQVVHEHARPAPGFFACKNCGHIVHGHDAAAPCSNCKKNEWIPAIY